MQSPPLLQGAGEEEEGLSSTPSFRRMPTHDVLPGFEESACAASLFGSPPEIPAVDSRHEGVNPVGGGDDGDDDDDDGSEEFEFSVLSRDSFDGIEPIAADEIFSNGQIRPIYPLFGRALFLDDAELLPREGEGGRHGDPAAAAAVETGDEIGKAARLPLGKLMMEERDPPSTSSSEADELEGVPAENYCLWAPRSVPPSPDLGNRSHSTGDSSKRWRLRDLVIGRSHSDGRKKFFFLAPPHSSSSSSSAETGEKACKSPSRDGGAAPSATPAAGGEKRKGKGKGRGAVRVVEMDMATAHRLYYGKGGAAGAAAAAAGDRRRSYLPYRQGLVGIFSNVNGGGGGGRPFHPI